jgi:hypothetical protein
METPEERLSRLRQILDKLQPGISLHIDVQWMKQLFGPNLTAAIKAAEEFAKQNGCTFQYVQSEKVGVWLRP